MKIKVIMTTSNAKTVQIVKYQNINIVILQHICSTHSQEKLNNLMILAEELK